MGNKFTGIIVPMITPFNENGSIDPEGVRKVVDHLVEARISGIFALGTTGEAASIPSDDRRELVKLTASAVSERAVLYAGISGNCLRESLEAAGKYADTGADALVAHPPYYYPVTDDDLCRYYEELADAVQLPLILYNIPQTTGVSIPPGTIESLSRHQNIVAIKDSENDLPRFEQVLDSLTARNDFTVLTGHMPFAAIGFRKGARGAVPMAGNSHPHEYRKLYDAAIAEDWAALEKQQQVVDEISQNYHRDRVLGQALPEMKRVMSEMGLCQPHVLPPLRPVCPPPKSATVA